MSKRQTPLSPAADAFATTVETQRRDQLDALVDHCLAAQSIADARNEKFLSYMLAMTIQAARALTSR